MGLSGRGMVMLGCYVSVTAFELPLQADSKFLLQKPKRDSQVFVLTTGENCLIRSFNKIVTFLTLILDSIHQTN